ncbi:hypothetical protein [Anaerovibrio sp.]|uniref:hypothetical protein n=1 Tax=Anaerovibrio sp. TaxID=1872532 RepID=UPI003F155C24
MTNKEFLSAMEALMDKKITEALAAKKAKKAKKETKSMTLEAVVEWANAHDLPATSVSAYTDKQGKQKAHVFLYTTCSDLEALETELQELGFVPSAFTRPEPLYHCVHGWAINLAKEAE